MDSFRGGGGGGAVGCPSGNQLLSNVIPTSTTTTTDTSRRTSRLTSLTDNGWYCVGFYNGRKRIVPKQIILTPGSTFGHGLLFTVNTVVMMIPMMMLLLLLLVTGTGRTGGGGGGSTSNNSHTCTTIIMIIVVGGGTPTKRTPKVRGKGWKQYIIIGLLLLQGHGNLFGVFPGPGHAL